MTGLVQRARNLQARQRRHRTGEILGAMLNTTHNLHYYQALMAQMRKALENTPSRHIEKDW